MDEQEPREPQDVPQVREPPTAIDALEEEVGIHLEKVTAYIRDTS